MLQLAIPASALAQQYNVNGKWENANSQWDKMSNDPTPELLSGGGTHMALLRGNADSTWILHWHENQHARLWLVEPANSGVGVDVPTTLSEIFCSGHSTLADGSRIRPALRNPSSAKGTVRFSRMV